MVGGCCSSDLFPYEFPELAHRDGNEHGGVRGLRCRGGLVHGGPSCALHSISVPQVHFLVMEVLGVSGSLIPNSSNWAGLSSWLITHARSTGPSLSNSSCRLGPGFVGGFSCKGDALSLAFR